MWFDGLKKVENSFLNHNIKIATWGMEKGRVGGGD